MINFEEIENMVIIKPEIFRNKTGRKYDWKYQGESYCCG